MLKYCDFKSTPDIFEGVPSSSDGIPGGALGGKVGLAFKKEAFISKSEHERQQEHVHISWERKKPKR